MSTHEGQHLRQLLAAHSLSVGGFVDGADPLPPAFRQPDEGGQDEAGREQQRTNLFSVHIELALGRGYSGRGAR